jgi:hypothetical protein
MIFTVTDREAIVANDGRYVWVDCRKTRAIVDEWDRASKARKGLAPANRLQSLTGTVDGAVDDFARVTPPTLKQFADRCEHVPEYFHADQNELQDWLATQVGKPLVGPVSGSGVASQVKNLEQIYLRLCGFYELYHHATSKREAGNVSVALLHVNKFDPASCSIHCELRDTSGRKAYFHMVGRITEFGGFLDWSLGPTHDITLCHAFSYLPRFDQKNPGFTIYGIFLSLSGDERLDYPVAARGALRFLGETASEAIGNSVVNLQLVDGTAEELLKNNVGGYLNYLQEGNLLRSDVLKIVKGEILPRISNAISTDAKPRALVPK